MYPKQSIEPRIIDKNASVYGARSRPRTSEPSMYQIINCRDRNFDETRNHFTQSRKVEKLKIKENEEIYNPGNHYMSETHYKFRPYAYEGSEQVDNKPEPETSKEIVLCVQDGNNKPVYLRFDSEAAMNVFLAQIEAEQKNNEEKPKQSPEVKSNSNARSKLKTAKKPIFICNPSKEEMHRIKKFNEQTRSLPNSAFQTYYGRPAFECYGMGNTHPVWGGLGYGDYLKSFNINPQRGDNNPAYEQVFKSTAYASFKVDYDKDHMPRKCKDEYRLSDEAIDRQKNRLKLLPEKKEVMQLGKLERPDLTQTAMFRSKPDADRRIETEEKENQVIEEIKNLKAMNKRGLEGPGIIDNRRKLDEVNYDDNQVAFKQLANKRNENMNKSVYNPENYIETKPHLVEETPYVSKVVKFVRV